jgi:uncharacterized membrane protein YoaK (UPF0700 family)
MSDAASSALILLRVILVAGFLACVYGFWNVRWRNAMSGNLVRFKGVPRTGAPASVRTHSLSLLFWIYAILLAFQVSRWNDLTLFHSVPLIAVVIATMLSSAVDVNQYDQ